MRLFCLTLMVIMGLCLASCEIRQLDESEINKIKQENTKDNTYRFENEEVICYRMYGQGGLSCKWK